MIAYAFLKIGQNHVLKYLMAVEQVFILLMESVFSSDSTILLL